MVTETIVHKTSLFQKAELIVGRNIDSWQITKQLFLKKKNLLTSMNYYYNFFFW